MKSINDYLNDVKQKLALETDYKLAKWLECRTGALSNYRSKKAGIDNYRATKIAEALNISPMEIIATAEAEREKNEEQRNYWKKLALAAIITSSYNGTAEGATNAASIENSAHYAPLRDRRKRRPTVKHWRSLIRRFDRRKSA